MHRMITGLTGKFAFFGVCLLVNAAAEAQFGDVIKLNTERLEREQDETSRRLKQQQRGGQPEPDRERRAEQDAPPAAEEAPPQPGPEPRPTISEPPRRTVAPPVRREAPAPRVAPAPPLRARPSVPPVLLRGTARASIMTRTAADPIAHRWMRAEHGGRAWQTQQILNRPGVSERFNDATRRRKAEREVSSLQSRVDKATPKLRQRD